VKPIFHLLWISSTKKKFPLYDNEPKIKASLLTLMLFSEHPLYQLCLHFFVLETLLNNLTNQQMINLWTFLMNFLKCEMLVRSDALINCVFHVLSDKERMSRSLIMKVCPALIKHFRPFPHIWLIHYTFSIHCNKQTVHFNSTDILCIKKSNYSSQFTTERFLDFLTHF
jgi:hypothetical protein